MRSSAWRARLRDESGFSLVELVVVCACMGIVLGAVVTILVSGQQASAAGQARETSQQNVRVAFDRLEYDARCADNATLLGVSGSVAQGVHLQLPTQCSHSTGDVTWCVNSGNLVRIVGTSCSTTGLTYVGSVTSATPFSCYSPVTGSLPQLKVALAVNAGSLSSEASSSTDYITLMNVNSSQGETCS